MYKQFAYIMDQVKAAEEKLRISFATDSLSEAVFPAEPLESLDDIKRDDHSSRHGEYIERYVNGQAMRFYVAQLSTERIMLGDRELDAFFHHDLIDCWDKRFMALLNESAEQSGLLGCRLKLTPSKDEILDVMGLIHSKDGLCEKLLMHRATMNSILRDWKGIDIACGKMEHGGRVSKLQFMGTKTVIPSIRKVFRDVYAFRTCPDFMLSYRSSPRITVEITGDGASVGCSFNFIRAITDCNGVARLKLANNAEESD